MYKFLLTLGCYNEEVDISRPMTSWLRLNVIFVYTCYIFSIAHPFLLLVSMGFSLFYVFRAWENEVARSVFRRSFMVSFLFLFFGFFFAMTLIFIQRYGFGFSSLIDRSFYAILMILFYLYFRVFYVLILSIHHLFKPEP